MNSCHLPHRLLPALLALFLPLQAAFSADDERDSALVDVLFSFAWVNEIKPARLDAADRACFSLFLQRGGRDVGQGPRGQPGPELVAARRVYLGKQAGILSGNPAEAAIFAQSAMISVEWEGKSEDPMSEADQALEWLAENPTTPLRPYLNLYSAYRFRSAYEAAHLERATRLFPIASAGYKEQLAAARESTDPLVRCLADQMDALPYLYMPNRGRP